MKLIIFGGTPGAGKTSVIKHTLYALKETYSIFFAKFDCMRTRDDEVIAQSAAITTEKKLAGEVCPDHYMALEVPKLLKRHRDKDLIILETAGLCLRCSPYVAEGLGINVLDSTSGEPYRYGPILTQADIVAMSKGDLISQAEREIFRAKIMAVNPTAHIIEVNGLTGEGSLDLAEYIELAPTISTTTLTLKHSMPSGICGYCYGNKLIDKQAVHDRFVAGRELKGRIPNTNCGKCGYTSCNEFIRAVLEKKASEEQCPFIEPSS